MKTSIRTTLLSALLAVSVALPAAAIADDHRNSGSSNERGGGNDRGGGNGRGGSKGHSVPEFDITAVGAIAALIGTGGIVLARRRKS